MKKIIDKLEEGILLALLIAICFTMVIQVLFRYGLDNPLIWTEELARFLLVWLTLLGAGYAVRKNLHIEMPFFFEKFSGKAKLIGQIIINLLCIVFFVYFLPVSIETVGRQHMLESTSLGIPLSYLYIAVPIGFTVLILRLIEHTINIIRNRTKSGLEGRN